MAYDPIKVSSVRALHKDVLVYDMDFGEQITSGGIVIKSDDGQAHGVKPRWGKVYKVGPEQKDVKIGQWVLVEHGRWTRKMKIDDGESIKEIQKIDIECMLAVADERPSDAYIGTEYSNGSSMDIRPEDFIR
jgi:co-chaperonin GroES (HSP10)